MRAVVQRVREASVTVDGTVVSAIGAGLLVLLGVGRDDGERDIAWMARKLPALRIFTDGQGLMNLSLEATGGSILLVSQFTLYGDCRKGNRPSFIAAGEPDVAERHYLELLRQLREKLGTERVAGGVFGASMAVQLLNDGPVTLILDSPSVAATTP